MSKVYRLSRSALRLLYKIRHHRGHGVHSPLVFSLITKVVEEKLPYYAYKDIASFLEEHSIPKQKEAKINRLTFRLVNFFNPKNILELGGGKGISTLYLTAPSKNIVCNVVEQSNKKQVVAQKLYRNWERTIILHREAFPILNKKQDCVFVDLNNYTSPSNLLIPYLLSTSKDDSIIIMKGIRTNSKHRMLWKELSSRSETSLRLDLYHLGIVFLDKKLHKRTYKISF